jgi:hypothetical protein
VSQEKQPEKVSELESSVVVAAPSIQVDIATKKSLRVRNCGERIGDDIPFIALLVHTNPYDSQSRKTLSKGVLISENFVLTTVSSVYHSESFWTVSSVRLGDFVTWNKYANRDKSYSVEIEVDEIFFHKKRDVALIKLKESVNFTDIIRPACLPQSDNYNFKELKSHLCKRAHHPKTPADVTLEFAVGTFDSVTCIVHDISVTFRHRSRPLTAGSSSRESASLFRRRSFACGTRRATIVRVIWRRLSLPCTTVVSSW